MGLRSDDDHGQWHEGWYRGVRLEKLWAEREKLLAENARLRAAVSRLLTAHTKRECEALGWTPEEADAMAELDDLLAESEGGG